MNIVFCVNNAYIPNVRVVMTSVLENHLNTEIKFYILSSDLTDESLENLNSLTQKYKNFTVKSFHVAKERFSSFNTKINYISNETFYRYLLAEFLSEEDKALYLDADLVVNGNLSDFYDMDISDYYVAGVEDLFIKDKGLKKNINLSDDDLYINTGVLLMNLDKMRQDNIPSKLLQTTKEKSDIFSFADQDCINLVCQGKIKQVDSIYNFTMRNVRKEKAKRKHACIIHFTGAKKPWNTKKVNMYSIWKKYSILSEMRRENIFQSFFKKIFG